MSESNLTNQASDQEQKPLQHEQLIKYIDLLINVGQDFTHEVEYEVYIAENLSRPHFSKDVQRRRKMVYYFREYLLDAEKRGATNKCIWYQRLLSDVTSQGISRSLVTRMGLADEIVRRQIELAQHNTVSEELDKLKLVLEDSLARDKTSTNASTAFDVERAALSTVIKRTQHYIDEESQLISNKKQELEKLWQLCFTRYKDLVENYEKLRAKAEQLLTTENLALANVDACRNNFQYVDTQADALIAEIKMFLIDFQNGGEVNVENKADS